jgi:hypothetical protein
MTVPMLSMLFLFSWPSICSYCVIYSSYYLFFRQTITVKKWRIKMFPYISINLSHVFFISVLNENYIKIYEVPMLTNTIWKHYFLCFYIDNRSVFNYIKICSLTMLLVQGHRQANQFHTVFLSYWYSLETISIWQFLIKLLGPENKCILIYSITL